MTDVLELVGGNIRRFRKARGLSLEELAERADSNPKYLGGVERGEQNIGLKKLALVSRALGVQLYELLIPYDGAENHDELFSLVKAADLPTKDLLLDFLKLLPAWRERVLSKRRRG